MCFFSRSGYRPFIRSSLKPGPARPTSLKTVLARPKIRPGQEDMKSRRWLIKGDRRRLLRNYVVVRRRREHAPSNPATLCLISSKQTVSSISQTLSCFTGLKVIVAQDKTPKRGSRLLRLPVVDNPHGSRLTCCPPHN